MQSRCALMWLCLAACSSPKAEPPKPTASTTATVMRQLLSEIERPGRQHEIDASSFFGRSDSFATLVSAYQESNGAWAQWKLLRLARKARHPDVTAFLKAEALKPVRLTSVASLGLAETVGNEEYVNRLEAALGVVDAMPGSESEVEEIIASVDAVVARVVGSELWSRGMLTGSLVAALQGRGLPTQFRRLAESEERALMSVEPSRCKTWKLSRAVNGSHAPHDGANLFGALETLPKRARSARRSALSPSAWTNNAGGSWLAPQIT